MTTLEIINQIEADKVSGRIEPHYALRVDVAKAMNISHAEAFRLLQTLCDQKIIRMGNTLNDYYIILQQNRL